MVDEMIKQVKGKVLRPSCIEGRPQFEELETHRNRMIASMRSVIENVNARIKTFHLIGEPLSPIR